VDLRTTGIDGRMQRGFWGNDFETAFQGWLDAPEIMFDCDFAGVRVATWASGCVLEWFSAGLSVRLIHDRSAISKCNPDQTGTILTRSKMTLIARTGSSYYNDPRTELRGLRCLDDTVDLPTETFNAVAMSA
jgi:hypothetical protein